MPDTILPGIADVEFEDDIASQAPAYGYKARHLSRGRGRTHHQVWQGGRQPGSGLERQVPYTCSAFASRASPAPA